MNELEQIALKIRSLAPEPISQLQPIPQPQDISKPQPIPQPQDISKPQPIPQPQDISKSQPIPQPQPIPPPVYRQESEISELIQIDSKYFKVKFRDYTPTEKTIRVITESIALALIIFFPIFAIWSGINKLYMNIVISIIIMLIYFIPHEMLEKRLRNRVRKHKELVAKCVKLQNAQSVPSDKSPPLFQLTERREPEKVICQNCGSESLKKYKYCKNCGNRLD
jgi:hypothetical protein